MLYTIYHRRHPDHLVALGAGDFLHHGRPHPCAACDRHYCRFAQSHRRAQFPLTTAQTQTWKSGTGANYDEGSRFGNSRGAFSSRPVPGKAEGVGQLCTA